MDHDLILASASPRRKEILTAAGIPCSVMPSGLEEHQRPGEPAEDFVKRVAVEKALDVLSKLTTNGARTVLGADTVVLIDRLTLGKPQSADDAARMLRLLSGRSHRVLTGVCLLHAPAGMAASSPELWRDLRVASTRVDFSPLHPSEIDDYVKSGEPMDKAGAYAIQGLASRFVRGIEGCYFNVVGLPVSLVYEMLQALPTGGNRDTVRR
jgi:nucleoside triphosphate pyrophosphatase